MPPIRLRPHDQTNTVHPTPAWYAQLLNNDGIYIRQSEPICMCVCIPSPVQPPPLKRPKSLSSPSNPPISHQSSDTVSGQTKHKPRPLSSYVLASYPSPLSLAQAYQRRSARYQYSYPHIVSKSLNQKLQCKGTNKKGKKHHNQIHSKYCLENDSNCDI